MNELRATIIRALKDRLERDPGVHAAWLEGADALARVDEFSDIDFCCSVDSVGLDGAVALAQEALLAIGPLDLVQRLDRPANQRHVVFHLSEASPYLLVDFVAHEGTTGSRFIAGDEIEKPLVLFDRGGWVRFRSPEAEPASLDLTRRLQDLRRTVSQASRVDKHIRRGEFLEAFGYYQKWLLEPLITCLRLRCTPLHSDYSIVHISRHLPAAEVRRLEELFQVRSMEELKRKSREAIRFFEEAAREIERG